MEIRARVTNRVDHHDVEVSTNGSARFLTIPPRETGLGSSVNGGEFLALALATCYCNDLYREASPLGISIESVAVEVRTTFGTVGQPASDIRYDVVIATDAPEDAVRRLAQHTDAVAEVHNTLRLGTQVRLESVVVRATAPASSA